MGYNFYAVTNSKDETKNGLYFGKNYLEFDEDWSELRTKCGNYYQNYIGKISGHKQGYIKLSIVCKEFEGMDLDKLKRGEVIKQSMEKEHMNTYTYRCIEEFIKRCCNLLYNCNDANRFYAVEYNSFTGNEVFDYNDYPSVLYYWIKYGIAYVKQYEEVYQKLFGFLGEVTPNILSIGCGAGQDFYSAVNKYDGDLEYTGCDINDWNIRFTTSPNCKEQWIIRKDYADKLKDECKGKKNILFFPKVLSEICTDDKDSTKDLMEKIINDIELADEGYVCIYTRSDGGEKSNKAKYERENTIKIVKALEQRGFKIEVLKQKEFGTFEIDKLSQYNHKVKVQLSSNGEDLLGDSYYYYVDFIKEEEKALKAKNIDKKLSTYIMTNLEKNGAYIILKYTKQ